MNLYKLILVDDEEDVRVSIERKVDWQALGFELAGSVSNGEEALELAEQMGVDVVMTDIKMPFMDGLTLCAKLKENYKNTKVVLYSGFDDFEFAREAIHLEAEEYLLKPIGARDLENVFRKIRQNLDKEFDERRDKEKLYDYYQKSLPMMKEQLLTGILEGNIAEEHARTMIQTYGMQFLSPVYAVALVGTNLRTAGEEPQAGQMLLLSLKNLAMDYLEKNMKTQTVMYLDRIVIIARLQKEEDIQEFIYHINQVCKIGARMLELDVDAGIGHACSQISQIATSYEEAKEAFDYRVLMGESSHAIYINDVEPQKPGNVLKEPLELQNILRNMKLGTREELELSIDKFIRELKEYKISMQQYQLTFMEMMTEILKLLRSYELDMTEIFGETFEPYQEMGKFHSPDELAEWMKDKCGKIRHLIREERKDSTKTLTEKARQYIEENYADSTLSVEHLCRHLNVSATYFSVLFKKETGMSFVSYLTKVRLEHAIELLDHTEDKSYMIAEKVGYTEANYFSYVFKKKYGVSPSRYRQNKGR